VDEIDALVSAPRLERSCEVPKKNPSLQAHDRRSPSSPRRRFVLEGGYVVAAREQAPDLRALDALAAAVGEAHRADPAAAAFVEVLGDHGHDVARRERVEIEVAGDGELDGLSVLRRIVAFGQWLTRTSKDPELSAW